MFTVSCADTCSLQCFKVNNSECTYRKYFLLSVIFDVLRGKIPQLNSCAKDKNTINKSMDGSGSVPKWSSLFLTRVWHESIHHPLP